MLGKCKQFWSSRTPLTISIVCQSDMSFGIPAIIARWHYIIHATLFEEVLGEANKNHQPHKISHPCWLVDARQLDGARGDIRNPTLTSVVAIIPSQAHVVGETSIAIKCLCTKHIIYSFFRGFPLRFFNQAIGESVPPSGDGPTFGFLETLNAFSSALRFGGCVLRSSCKAFQQGLRNCPSY